MVHHRKWILMYKKYMTCKLSFLGMIIGKVNYRVIPFDGLSRKDKTCSFFLFCSPMASFLCRQKFKWCLCWDIVSGILLANNFMQWLYWILNVSLSNFTGAMSIPYAWFLFYCFISKALLLHHHLFALLFLNSSSLISFAFS